MPVTISDDEYKLLLAVKHNMLREQKLDSVQSMGMLENDIDVPIKKLVALFALLGCNPLFSCCGFDYAGQPIHKTHEYGNAFIIFEENKASANIFRELVDGKYVCEGFDNKELNWRTYLSERNRRYFSSSFVWWWEDIKYPWANKNCIHFSELGAINIAQIEKAFLRAGRSAFLDSVIVKDTNEAYKKNVPYWQYPSLKPWIILKEDYLGDE